MPYILLEVHGGPEYAIIITDEDGNNKVYDSYDEVLIESLDLQDGVIVEIY